MGFPGLGRGQGWSAATFPLSSSLIIPEESKQYPRCSGGLWDRPSPPHLAPPWADSRTDNVDGYCADISFMVVFLSTNEGRNVKKLVVSELEGT